jgi:hypothetical protein
MTEQGAHPLRVPPFQLRDPKAINWENMPVEQQISFLRADLDVVRDALARLHAAFLVKSDGTIILKKNLVIDSGVDIVLRDS